MKYKYIINSTNDSSSKFGNCEICNKQVSEVFIQVEQRKYIKPDGEISFTGDKCTTLYGHKECLLNKQRNIHN